MNVAVVILNWNGKDLLEKFLPKVIEYSKNDAEIYVADNNSTDDSISFLSNSFPDVKVIQNSTNGGYAKGYNDALKNVKADLYVLLNSDIEVTNNWLKPVIQHFEKNNNTAAAQPKLLDYKNKSKFEYAGAAGGYVDFLGYPFCKGRIFNSLEEDCGEYNDIYNIFWATGACLFIRSEIYHNLNGLDEDYFAHQEEIDLCWRIQNEGFDIQYIGSSEVYHVGGATLNESNPHKTYLNFRNSLFTICKNVPKRFMFFVLLFRLVLDGVAGLKFILELRPIHTLSIIRAHFSFYWYLPKTLKKRRKISFKQTKYYYCYSIVWQHFVLRRKKFSEIK